MVCVSYEKRFTQCHAVALPLRMRNERNFIVSRVEIAFGSVRACFVISVNVLTLKHISLCSEISYVRDVCPSNPIVPKFILQLRVEMIRGHVWQEQLERAALK